MFRNVLLLSGLMALFTVSASSSANDKIDLDAIKAENAKVLESYAKGASITNNQTGLGDKSLPNTETQSKIDIGSMVDKFNQSQQGDEKRKAGLYAFVSLSVPARDLKVIGQEIKKAGGIMVLRGFTKDTSAKQTAQALMAINKEVGAEWSLDPDMFQALDIQKVPAIAIVMPKKGEHKACQQNVECEPAFDSAIAYGDISVEEAMRRIMSSSQQKDIKYEAESVLKKLKM